MKLSLSAAAPSRRKQKLTVFVVLTLLLAPVLAIATVGGYRPWYLDLSNDQRATGPVPKGGARPGYRPPMKGR